MFIGKEFATGSKREILSVLDTHFNDEGLPPFDRLVSLDVIISEDRLENRFAGP
jgi:hypothetical protein